MSYSQKNPFPRSYIELASIGHSSVGGGSIDDDSSNSVGTSYAPISGNFHTDENGKTRIFIVLLGFIEMPAITVQGGSAVEKGAKSFLGATNTVQTAVGSIFKNGASATVSSTKKVVEKLRRNPNIQKIGGGVCTVVRATSNVVGGAISKVLPPKKTIQQQFEEENLGSGNYSNDDEAESDLYISDTNSDTNSDAGSDDEYDIIEAYEAFEEK